MKAFIRVLLFVLYDNHGEIEIHMTDEQIHILAEILLPTVIDGIEQMRAERRKQEELSAASRKGEVIITDGK